ncbi:hypothetical protein DsansV1_C13g0118061 [Dioscorea sansibarensis]
MRIFHPIYEFKILNTHSSVHSASSGQRTRKITPNSKKDHAIPSSTIHVLSLKKKSGF